ncbi:MAG: formylglycine-generating enzyme family protein [Candidatus Methylumidiphilus sp.]
MYRQFAVLDAAGGAADAAAFGNGIGPTPITPVNPNNDAPDGWRTAPETPSVRPKKRGRMAAVALLVGVGIAVGVANWPQTSTKPTQHYIESFRDCPDCPEMIRLPGGGFTMGSDDSDPDAESDEKPAHKVKVAAFSLGKYEVTRGQFAAFVAATHHQAAGDWRNPSFDGKSFNQTDDHPVVNVSLQDAEAYIAWLNKKTGKTYRLPKEAEWEYAARVGSKAVRLFGTAIRPWGDGVAGACRYANVYDQTTKRTLNFSSQEHACEDGHVYTAPVGSFTVNASGLYDMMGNVWEWTCSTYTETYDGSEKTCTKDASGRRAVRGGSWSDRPRDVRSAKRGRSDPANRDYDLGFRLAQD